MTETEEPTLSTIHVDMFEADSDDLLGKIADLVYGSDANALVHAHTRACEDSDHCCGPGSIYLRGVLDAERNLTTVALANRVRSVVRLVSPDHMTPVAARQIEAALAASAGPDPMDALRAELFRLSDMMRDQNALSRELATALGERDDARRALEDQSERVRELLRERDTLCLLVEDLGGTVPE